MKMEGVATMDESKTTAPDKNQPHSFEAIPEVPGTMLEQGVTAEGMGQPPASNPKCALCGAPRADRIHTEAEADAASPNWGL